MNNLASRALVVLLAVGVLQACDTSTDPSDTASLRVLLTDAPSDYVGAAFVDIGTIELLPAGDGDRIVLSEDGTDGPVDLLDLQGLATELLADVEIPVGSYRELRLIVESASVTLADGYEFNSGGSEADLQVPSGAQTGIKLKLRADDLNEETDGSDGVAITAGETVLVVDFDVNQSFVIQGNPETPAGINGILFKPTLRVVVQDVAGSISGTLSTAIVDQSVDGLVVRAERIGFPEGEEEEFQSLVATGVSEAEGAYTIYFLAPGTYGVTVETPEGLATTPAAREVTVGEAESVDGVDFEIVSG